MSFIYNLISDKGKRDENQDNALVSINDFGYAIAVLADGMGGHIGGKTASTIAIKLINYLFGDLDLSKMNDKQIKKWSLQVVDAIRNEMILASKNDPRIDDMGTTLVFAIINKDKAYVVNIGDSRAYLINNQKKSIELITSDQNYINTIDDTDERRKVEQTIVGQYLTSSLGPNKQTKVDYYSINLDLENTILLTSDGIHKYIPSKVFEKIVLASNQKSILQKLIKFSKKYDSYDNMTAVIIKYKYS